MASVQTPQKIFRATPTRVAAKDVRLTARTTAPEPSANTASKLNDLPSISAITIPSQFRALPRSWHAHCAAPLTVPPVGAICTVPCSFTRSKSLTRAATSIRHSPGSGIITWSTVQRPSAELTAAKVNGAISIVVGSRRSWTDLGVSTSPEALLSTIRAFAIPARAGCIWMLAFRRSLDNSMSATSTDAFSCSSARGGGVNRQPETRPSTATMRMISATIPRRMRRRARWSPAAAGAVRTQRFQLAMQNRTTSNASFAARMSP